MLTTVGGIDSWLLELAPVLVLLLPLLAGRYLGEKRLAAVVAAFAPARRRAALRLTARLPRAPRAFARRGRLVASALAERGPPALAPAR
ncbi:hypothetical protein GKE82_12725 [Conexibacter sp. W3-3-2]|uniref:Uncharacterized protein n=1 Tax=Paraconexibacter algicola TaxID=2133960 RepID=A0A2T4UN92_9ACTN|nr:hypothetical protein [Conexibacter sp. W3-3-2]PTL60699.1 hypothetical protein C7Y72_03735 [Paraconexibacter algicola]